MSTQLDDPMVKKLGAELVEQYDRMDALLTDSSLRWPEWQFREAEKKIERLIEALKRHGVTVTGRRLEVKL